MSKSTSRYSELRVDGARLWDSLMELAKIGATKKGGVCRLALTDLDGAGRNLVSEWARALGCQIRIDGIGNIFMRRAGRRNDLPPVMAGSHIDTQPTGGKFDGNYGVLAGIEVLRTLEDHHIHTEAPIEVVAWTNEEGSRFVPVMMGSGVFAGAFTLEHALAQRDREGISVADALERIGYAGQQPNQPVPVHAYFEAHIEQGPILEAHDTVIGAVQGALGQRWYDVTIQGQEAHAGPTPMEMRQDALLGAAQLIQSVNAIALQHAPHGRGTVGWIDNFPNSRNVIPGRLRLTVDLRAADDQVLNAMDQSLAQACHTLEESSGLQVTLEPVVYFPPQAFDPELVGLVDQYARDLSHSVMSVVSGAGHDAVYLARVAPTAMIFVPCKDGISHNEIEDARPEHLEAGCNVLLHAMLRAAGVTDDTGASA